MEEQDRTAEQGQRPADPTVGEQPPAESEQGQEQPAQGAQGDDAEEGDPRGVSNTTQDPDPNVP